jgi:hypothetical protein
VKEDEQGGVQHSLRKTRSYLFKCRIAVPKILRCEKFQDCEAKMPKSKRAKLVSLTKTEKKTKEWKEGLFAKIQEAVQSYDYVLPLDCGQELMKLAGMGISGREYEEHIFKGREVGMGR